MTSKFNPGPPKHLKSTEREHLFLDAVVHREACHTVWFPAAVRLQNRVEHGLFIRRDIGDQIHQSITAAGNA